MSIECRQYELSTTGIEAIMLLNKKHVPIQVQFEEKGLEIQYESLVNLQNPEELFHFKVEDDIFAFIELRLDMLKPILKKFKAYDTLYNQRITYNAIHNDPLKIEITYCQSTPIILPELAKNLKAKVYKHSEEYQLEIEISIETPRGSSYPVNKTAVKKVVQELLTAYTVLDQIDYLNLGKSA